MSARMAIKQYLGLASARTETSPSATHFLLWSGPVSAPGRTGLLLSHIKSLLILGYHINPSLTSRLILHGCCHQYLRQAFHTEFPSAVNSPQYASLLRACTSSKCLIDGMRLHAQIIRHKLDVNALLGNLLIQMYGHCGALDEASAVFALLPHRDHFAWNFLIRSYAASGPPAEALL
eukprot:c9987_g1_i1 orf=1-528(-)